MLRSYDSKDLFCDLLVTFLMSQDMNSLTVKIKCNYSAQNSFKVAKLILGLSLTPEAVQLHGMSGLHLEDHD